MSYVKKIEVYEILDENFVTPLAVAPDDEEANYKSADLVIIVDDQVWVKNRDNQDDNVFSLAVYPTAFVRANPTLFHKISNED